MQEKHLLLGNLHVLEIYHRRRFHFLLLVLVGVKASCFELKTINKQKIKGSTCLSCSSHSFYECKRCAFLSCWARHSPIPIPTRFPPLPHHSSPSPLVPTIQHCKFKRSFSFPKFQFSPDAPRAGSSLWSYLQSSLLNELRI